MHDGWAEALDAYDRLVASSHGVERKGAKLPYTSVNGNMSSFLAETGMLALRLSPSDRTTFLARFETTLHEAHGHVMKEYVSVPAPLLADTETLMPWFAASLDYVAGLKPKATTRRPKT